MPKRKAPWVFASLLLLAAIFFTTTPLRYYIFHPKLTIAQRKILDQAEAGLAVYATRSTTAHALYADARTLARRAAFIPGAGTFTVDKRTRAPLAVAVDPSDQASTIASYNHFDDLLLFVESKCDSMSYVTLGLVYGHELRHRRDFYEGVYNRNDSLMSGRRLTTELRARQTVCRILTEFTSGRWDSAVEAHNKRFLQQNRELQRRFPQGTLRFEADVKWIRHEFGRISDSDLDYLLGQVWFDGALRLGLPDTTISAADSLRYNLVTMRDNLATKRTH